MHEFGLCEGIANAARERAKGRPVARVKVQVSDLLRAESESMEQAFSMIAAGTELDGARLDLVFVPGRGTCSDCGAEVEVSVPWDACSQCGADAVAVTNAEEMILQEMEYRPQAETG